MDKVAIVSFLFLLIFTRLNAQWQNMHGPNGGEITNITASGTTVYATLWSPAGSLWKSTDNGINWSLKRFDNAPIRDFVNQNNQLYALVETKGLYYSSDNGTTWILKTNGLPVIGFQNMGIYGQTILISAASSKLYRSTDNGSSFSLVTVPTGFAFALSQNNYFLGSNNGVYKSNDDGLTWTGSGLTGNTINVMKFNGNNLFAGTNSNGLYISTDYGSSWNQRNNGLTTTKIKSLCFSGFNIYCGTDSGIFISTNNGNSWNTAGMELQGNSNFIITSNTNILFTGTATSGVYSTTNNGANWTSIGIPAMDVGCITSDGINIFACTNILYSSSPIRGGIYTYNLASSKWKKIYKDDNNYSFSYYSLLVSGNNIYASKRNSYDNGGIIYSSNLGVNWSEIGMQGNIIRALINSGPNLIAGGQFGTYVTSNNGIIWDSTTGLKMSIWALGKSSTKVFAGPIYGIYQSTNNGVSWTVSSSVVNYVNAFKTYGSVIFAAAEFGAYYTTNDGNSWTKKGLSTQSVSDIEAYGSNTFACTYGGIYRSIGNDTNWSLLNIGLGSNIHFRTIYIHNNYCYLGTVDNSMYRIPVSELIGVRNISTEIPAFHYLHQNYPNPFNSSTKIKFELPERSYVKMLIYDMTGRIAVELIDETLNPGIYSIDWNASVFSSGVYYCKYETGNISTVRKLVLLK